MKDSYGEFVVISGHEGTGGCWWCGGELPKRRRYCCEACRDEYWRHFSWHEAVLWALERAGRVCHECGKKDTAEDTYFYTKYSDLVVHHIMPLEGEKRQFNAKNRPENLEVLCRRCHGHRHSGKPAREPSQQGVMEI